MTRDRHIAEARSTREARRIVNGRHPGEHIVSVRRVDPMTSARGFIVTTDPDRRADAGREAASR
jgi:hypothetical protein